MRYNLRTQWTRVVQNLLNIKDYKICDAVFNLNIAWDLIKQSIVVI